MKIKKTHWIGMISGAVIALLGLIFFFNENDMNLFFFVLGIGLAVFGLPFVAGIILKGKAEDEINVMFLEFSRNLAESVTTGTPISKSIINMRKKNYGELNPHIEKLANQIEIGIPIGRAFENFASDIDSQVIKRAVELIKEAEKAGGEIDYILESTAKSIAEIEKLKKERRAAVYNLVVQGYIIFFIFIGIMLVMEFKILPLTAGLGAIGGLGGGISSFSDVSSSSQSVDLAGLGRSFLYLLLAQGLFAGLTIGKLAEGKVKSGIKHSFILMIAAFLISTGAEVLLG